MAAGRPNKYEQWLTVEGLKQVEDWARTGLTDDQMAYNMGIGYSTFYDYKARFTELSEAIKRGKAVIDQQVENALLKRALGYRYDEVTREPGHNTEINPITGEEQFKMIETKRVTKEVPGDTTAQRFWLKNRKPEEWRDQQQVQHSGSLDIKQSIEQLSDEELEKMLDDASKDSL